MLLSFVLGWLVVSFLVGCLNSKKANDIGSSDKDCDRRSEMCVNGNCIGMDD